MKFSFSVNRRTLSNCLSSIQAILNKRTSLESTSCVLFHLDGSSELVLKATDLEMSMKQVLSLEALKGEPIDFLVHGRRLLEFVKEDVGDSLLFSYDGSRVLISSESVKNLDIFLATCDASSFPLFPGSIENLIEIESDFLKSSLNSLSSIVPQSNTNPAINGILFDFTTKNLSMVATDGHCLGKVCSDKFFLAKDSSWTLPKRSALELKRILDNFEDTKIFLGTCKGQVVFSGEDFNFYSKVLAEKFPAYQAILNTKGFNSGTVNSKELIPALRRAGYLLDGKFIAANFDFTAEGQISLTLDNKDIGKFRESVATQDFSGTNTTIKFYSPYVLSVLQAFESGKVTFFVKESTNPIFFSSELSEGMQATYLVMPVVNDQAG